MKIMNYKNKWTKHVDKIMKKLDTANKAPLERLASGEVDKKRKHELDLARKKTLGEQTKRQKLQESTVRVGLSMYRPRNGLKKQPASQNKNPNGLIGPMWSWSRKGRVLHG